MSFLYKHQGKEVLHAYKSDLSQVKEVSVAAESEFVGLNGRSL